MEKSVFKIDKMDCPSEEQMIRLKLEGLKSISSLNFDLQNRLLAVVHNNELSKITGLINELNLGSTLLTSATVENQLSAPTDKRDRKILWAVLAINFSFFIVEILTGFFSRSMGLVADSLDMLADSFVYVLSLLAIGGTIAKKKSVAKVSGYFQIVLALFGFAEVVQRFIGTETPPNYFIMIIVSVLALAGNAASLYILQKSKSTEAHIKASMIFTSNDVIINLGVILAGVLVYLLNSNKPDLIIGAIVFVIVLRGAVRILKLAK